MINNLNQPQEVFYHQQQQFQNYPHQGVQHTHIDTGQNFGVSDFEREREIEKQRKRDRLSKLKCSRGESWVWNPRQFYCQIMCPVCERGSRELTVLHFRNHLELQHTAEEVENVKVCKLCHRTAVQNRQDVFDGLILDLDPQAKLNHVDQKHQGHAHECEFMGIYEKHKRTMGDNWGLEGIERDSTKVYKYAKENFSRAKKNERQAANSSESADLSSIGGSCASITPEPPSNFHANFSSKSHEIKTETIQVPSGYSQGYDHAWSSQPSGFSYRGLLGDLDTEENLGGSSIYNTPPAVADSSPENSENHENSSESPENSLKRPNPVDSPNFDPKSRRLDRCADPELRKLRCGIGGSYRFSMSKLHFSKVSCPYCLLPSDGENSGKVYIKAEYWRRHVTEVHNKPEEIEETKKLVLCLECYNSTLSKKKEGENSNLPEFDALFKNQEEQDLHVKEVHNGNEVEFISVWDKKEAAGSSTRSPRMFKPEMEKIPFPGPPGPGMIPPGHNPAFVRGPMHPYPHPGHPGFNGTHGGSQHFHGVPPHGVQGHSASHPVVPHPTHPYPHHPNQAFQNNAPYPNHLDPSQQPPRPTYTMNHPENPANQIAPVQSLSCQTTNQNPDLNTYDNYHYSQFPKEYNNIVFANDF